MKDEDTMTNGTPAGQKPRIYIASANVEMNTENELPTFTHLRKLCEELGFEVVPWSWTDLEKFLHGLDNTASVLFDFSEDGDRYSPLGMAIGYALARGRFLVGYTHDGVERIPKLIRETMMVTESFDELARVIEGLRPPHMRTKAKNPKTPPKKGKRARA